ncbi:MAG TPA: c-type cytochrome [Candidatus Aquilonibacter sp.]|nr:c-type cytochrome [Candidatus Aquilonibacter sp.]
MKIGSLLLFGLSAAALVIAQSQAPQPAAPPAAASQQPAEQPAAAQQPGEQPAANAPPAEGAAQPGGRGGRGRGGRAPAYPVRPPADPALVARGKQIFSANCSFCHGSDARGGEGGGPNLIRSELVMDDNNGEKIATVVLNGRPGTAMPKFDLSMADISAIAAYIHSFPVGGRAATTGMVDPVVGNAGAGETFFNGAGKCNTCHSVTGDLAGIGERYSDARALQGAMLSGGAERGRGAVPSPETIKALTKTVTVTFPNGKVVSGDLEKVDDFLVTLTDAEGDRYTFVRNGDVPKVVVKNPVQPHLDMLLTLTDDDIHNLTAYLVTLK